MRNYVLISILLAIFIGGSVFLDFHIDKELTEMENAVKSIDGQEDLKIATEKWEKLSDYFEMIIYHGDLEEVSRQLWAMEEELKYDYDEFMESKALAAQTLSHIKKRNTIGIVNIL